MKARRFGIVCFVLLCAATAAYAEDPTVMVSLFESKPEDEALARRSAIITSEEVMRAKGFKYLSPTDYVRQVIDRDAPSSKEPPDLNREYSDRNLNELKELCKPYEGKTTFVERSIETAAIVMGGMVESGKGMVRAEPMIMSTRSQRAYTAAILSPEGRYEADLRSSVQSLLQTIIAAEKVYADKVSDPELSKVAYMIKADDGALLTVEADYTSNWPDPALQELGIRPPEDLAQDGVKAYTVKSLEGKPVTVEFTRKDGKIGMVKVDTAIPDPANDGPQAERLTLKSEGGYILDFDFSWKKKEMTGAYLTPRVNPFSDALAGDVKTAAEGEIASSPDD